MKAFVVTAWCPREVRPEFCETSGNVSVGSSELEHPRWESNNEFPNSFFLEVREEMEVNGNSAMDIKT